MSSRGPDTIVDPVGLELVALRMNPAGGEPTRLVIARAPDNHSATSEVKLCRAQAGLDLFWVVDFASSNQAAEECLAHLRSSDDGRTWVEIHGGAASNAGGGPMAPVAWKQLGDIGVSDLAAVADGAGTLAVVGGAAGLRLVQEGVAGELRAVRRIKPPSPWSPMGCWAVQGVGICGPDPTLAWLDSRLRPPRMSDVILPVSSTDTDLFLTRLRPVVQFPELSAFLPPLSIPAPGHGIRMVSLVRGPRGLIATCVPDDRWSSAGSDDAPWFVGPLNLR